MAIRDARDLFVYELSGLCDLERSIQQDLPTMTSECSTHECRTLFQRDQREIQREISNLDQCFQVLGRQPVQVGSHVVEGLHEDKRSFAEQNPSPDLIEWFNLDAAAKIEHLEVASYRSLVDMAQQLGETECARLLQENLRMEEDESREVEQVLHQVSHSVLGRQPRGGSGM